MSGWCSRASSSTEAAGLYDWGMRPRARASRFVRARHGGRLVGERQGPDQSNRPGRSPPGSARRPDPRALRTRRMSGPGSGPPRGPALSGLGDCLPHLATPSAPQGSADRRRRPVANSGMPPMSTIRSPTLRTEALVHASVRHRGNGVTGAVARLARVVKPDLVSRSSPRPQVRWRRPPRSRQ